MGIDGDGLFLVTNCLELVSGYPLAVLTPNINEYKRLVHKVLNSEVNDQNGTDQLLSLAKGIGGVTVLRKGKSDFISDGKTACAVSIYGSPRRCGGQGDILSGSIAVFLSWARQYAAKGEVSMNPTILGCVAGSALLRRAASLAFETKKRSTLTGVIIECLGRRKYAQSNRNFMEGFMGAQHMYSKLEEAFLWQRAKGKQRRKNNGK